MAKLQIDGVDIADIDDGMVKNILTMTRHGAEVQNASWSAGPNVVVERDPIAPGYRQEEGCLIVGFIKLDIRFSYNKILDRAGKAAR